MKKKRIYLLEIDEDILPERIENLLEKEGIENRIKYDMMGTFEDKRYWDMINAIRGAN